jgi:electron transport complex protein RnfA
MGLELLWERIFPLILSQVFPKHAGIKKVFSAFTAYDGLAPVSLLITFTIAGSFIGAFVLALFFVVGNLAAMLALNEIRRRSNLESVPLFLRGSPLILISMGLLSLVSASAAGICFMILEVLR